MAKCERQTVIKMRGNRLLKCRRTNEVRRRFLDILVLAFFVLGVARFQRSAQNVAEGSAGIG